MARNAELKLVDTVATTDLFGVGLAPAPIIPNRPHTPIITTAKNPSQLRRLKVRGNDKKNTATEKIRRRYIAHNPSSDRVESAS